MNREGQISLWVAIAIVLAIVIIVFFVLNRNVLPNISTNSDDIVSSIKKCVSDSTTEAIGKMLPQGGFLEPTDYKLYNNISISYLCENKGDYKPCINQHPMLITEESNEIENYISPIVDNCFNNFKANLEKQGYAISMGSMELNVSLVPDKVNVDINREVSLTKNEKTSKTDSYHVEINSPIYDLSNVAIEIANQQAKQCYFEYVGYMFHYPRFDIRVISLSDPTRIYNIRDKNTDKEMNIAIRSCVIPSG